MRAVLLVGGEGTRLRPLTAEVPKQMLDVAGCKMIERVLAHLAAHGVEEAVLSLGYRAEEFREAFPAGSACGVRLTYAVDPEPLDTGGAIRYAAVEAGYDSETILVVNADVLTDLDVGALVAFHRKHEAEATISLTPVGDPSAFGVVVTEKDGRVLSFVEKPPPGTAPSNLINAGTYVLEPSVLDRVPKGRRVSVERETFPALVAGGRMFAMASGAYWVDTGTPATYLRACTDIAAGLREAAVLPGAEEVSPGVWVAPSARVAGELRAPSAVFAGCRVAATAVVEGSVLGPGVQVAPGTRVSGSVLMEGASAGEGSVIERSIVGPGAEVGAGASVTALSILGAGASVAAGERLDGARALRP